MGCREQRQEGTLDILDELLDQSECDEMPQECPTSCFACYFHSQQPCTRKPNASACATST